MYFLRVLKLGIRPVCFCSGRTDSWLAWTSVRRTSLRIPGTKTLNAFRDQTVADTGDTFALELHLLAEKFAQSINRAFVYAHSFPCFGSSLSFWTFNIFMKILIHFHFLNQWTYSIGYYWSMSLTSMLPLLGDVLVSLFMNQNNQLKS